ncbi:MAG: ribonuclease HII [Eubacteriales bacterium]|nr:ribonuclease HII [Eubacteriales bacterium]MDD3873987.1 ribonuclease HII [Methanosarcina sp.]MDD4583260.1 ribonuclease HII [Eubacteriales bacterium]
MREYEEALFRKGIRYIAGVDEVGRGPLAGPVVAAAVVLPLEIDINGINDSKKLTAKKREELDLQIREIALGIGLGVVDNHMIDEINILEATKLAMRQALMDLEKICPIQYILLDAITLNEVSVPQKGIIKGDAKSISIAAASIVAKVARDRMMVEYHNIYPDYAFNSNKGYGTKAHYAGIEAKGICSLHRRTFLRRINLDK